MLRISCLYTLLAGKPGFLHFRGKHAGVEVRLAGGFFEHRAFQADTLEAMPDGNGYCLTQTMHGWYYLPFKEKQKTSDWWGMDNEKRDKIYGPDLEFKVEVQEIQGGIELGMHVRGVQGAPFRVEFAVKGAEYVQGKGFWMEAGKGDSLLLKSEDLFLGNSEESLQIGPGFAVHRGSDGGQRLGIGDARKVVAMQ